MPGVEDTIPSQYVQAFEANLQLLPQQKDARLVERVDSNLRYAKNGDMFNGDDLGTSDPQEITDRFGPSPEGATSKRRRVGFFSPYDDGKFLDDIDTAKSLSDPSNETMQAMQAGHNRFRDRVIIAALGGNAREGRNGENIVALPASQTIAIDSWAYVELSIVPAPVGNSALTLSKLIETKVKLDAAETDDMGMPSFAAPAEQLGQLLRDRNLTSADYNTVRALVNGEIDTFMGFKFVRTQQLPKAAGVRTCYGWKKNALMYRARMLTEATITKRADRRFNWYAYYKGMHGAVRRYDEGVVAVPCVEA